MNLKEYENLSIQEQVRFVSHYSTNIVSNLFFSQDRKGLSTFIANLELILNHAHDCLGCIDFLHDKGDVFNKINLLIDYLGQNDMNQKVLQELQQHVNIVRSNLKDNENDVDMGFTEVTEADIEPDDEAIVANFNEISQRDMQRFKAQLTEKSAQS